ncbi:hypothetical protein D3C87_19040 [compost metagenome]
MSMTALERILQKKWMIGLLFLSITVLFATKSDHRYGWSHYDEDKAIPILSDGAGYYAFLPRWYIHHSSNFEFIDTIQVRYPNAGFTANIDYLPDGRRVDKYFTGTAVCLTPFFAIGHIQAGSIGEIQDGYSWPYLFWLCVGIICYSVLGLWGLFLVLKKFRISWFAIYITILGFAVGTNLCFYSYRDVPYAHIFSFSVISWMFYALLIWIDENRLKHLLFFSLLFGLSMIIRPTNGLFLLIVPFLFPDNKTLWERLKQLFQHQITHLITAIVVFLIPIAIQVYSSYQQFGKVQFNGYNNEGFSNITDPYFWSTLFGFRKGIFIYAPFLLLIIPGFIVLFIKNRRLFYGLFLFFVVSVYILSSWWFWSYGGSLGYRSIVDFYSVLAVPIAFLLHYSKSLYKAIICLFVLASCYVYQVYEVQFQQCIIHFDEMDYPKWKHVFMKTDKRLNFMYYSRIDSLPEKITPVGPIRTVQLGGADMKREVIFDFLEDQPLKPNFHDSLAINPKLSSYRMGAKLTGEMYLYEPASVPTVIFYCFKNDSLVGKTIVNLGARMNQTKQWEKLEVDFDPLVEWNSFDFVNVDFYFDPNSAKIKNFALQFYKFK